VKFTRIDFIRKCAVALAGATVNVRALEGLSAVVAPDRVGGAPRLGRLQDATAATFRPHVRTRFSLYSTNGRAPLVLADVVERSVTRGVEQFSLIFHARPTEVVADGIHRLDHAVLGSFDLFIARVGSARGRATYQACFSRHLAAPGRDART